MSKIDQTQGRASRAIDRAPAPRDRGCEMTFETEARDRREMKEEGLIYKKLPQIFKFCLGT